MIYNQERAHLWMKALGYLASDQNDQKQHFDQMEQKYNKFINEFTMSNEKIILEQIVKCQQENQTQTLQEFDVQKQKIISQHMSVEQYQQNENLFRIIEIDAIRILSKFKYLKNPYHIHIEQLFDVNNSFQQLNQKEVSSTTYLDAMKRILYIYSRLHPNIGYISGMNYLLSPIMMIIQKEADCFFCFELLMERQQFYFKQVDNQKGLMSAFKRFDEMIEQQEPQIFEYLNKIGVILSQFFVTWFIALFARDLDIEIVIQLWDRMLFQDYEEYLFKIIVQILRIMKDEILKSNFDTIVRLFSHNNENQLNKIINSILNK